MLRNTIKELGRHSLIYMLGGIASTFASIALLPVYTRFLSKPDYGILEIIDSARYLFVILVLGGFVPAMAKFYKETESELTQREVVGTSFWFVLCSSILWSVLLILYDQQLATLLLGSADLVVFIDLGITLLLTQVLLLTGENYLNIRKQSRFFLIASLIKLGVNVSANLTGIVLLKLGPKGMLTGELLSNAVNIIILLTYLIKQNGLPFRLNLLGQMLKFGIPFVPNLFAATLMHRADRYLLQKFTSLADVGLYGLGFRFPYMFNFLILQSFGRIWNTSVMYEVAKQTNCQQTYAKITTYFMTIYVVCQYILAIMAPTIIHLLATPEYYAAWRVMQIVGLGLCGYSLHNFFIMGAYINNKTWYLPISHILSAMLSIGANWYLLPRYGYIAAAWNTVLTYFTFSALNFFIFHRIYPIPFEFKRLGFLFGGGIMLVILNNWLFMENNILEFTKECVFALIFPAILLIGPYLHQDEKKSLEEEFQKIHPQFAHMYAKMYYRIKR